MVWKISADQATFEMREHGQLFTEQKSIFHLARSEYNATFLRVLREQGRERSDRDLATV